jgi:hypothetical protein
MSELNRLAQPLLERPLVTAPSVEGLQRRSKARQRRRILEGGAVGVVMVAVVAVVLALVPNPSTPTKGPGRTSTLAAYIQKGVSVSDSTLEAVALPSKVLPPASLSGTTDLTDGGKPAVIYVGGEFCPYCAMQRWALVVALSRFGTFSDLGQTISSSSTDVFPGLQSWSFKGSRFSSPSLTFDPAEIYSSTPTGNEYEPLQSLSPIQKDAYDNYDLKYGGGIPFLDIGNKFLALGASASPSVLEGLSLEQIAADLSDASSPVAQAVDGTANYIIAAICSVAGSNAAPICSSPLIAEAQTAMASHSFNPSAPYQGQ